MSYKQHTAEVEPEANGQDYQVKIDGRVAAQGFVDIEAALFWLQKLGLQADVIEEAKNGAS